MSRVKSFEWGLRSTCATVIFYRLKVNKKVRKLLRPQCTVHCVTCALFRTSTPTEVGKVFFGFRRRRRYGFSSSIVDKEAFEEWPRALLWSFSEGNSKKFLCFSLNFLIVKYIIKFVIEWLIIIIRKIIYFFMKDSMNL